MRTASPGTFGNGLRMRWTCSRKWPMAWASLARALFPANHSGPNALRAVVGWTTSSSRAAPCFICTGRNPSR